MGPAAATIVKLLPNGDWRQPDRTEFYPDDMGNFRNVDKHVVAHFMAVALMRVFLPTILLVYKRWKWSGFHIAVDQQGGVDSCHRLFSRTVKRF